MPFPRHRVLITVLLFVITAPATTAAPATLDTLTSKDAASGLRAALSQGVDVAVAQLGAQGGFLNDPKVAIPLPPALEKADRALRMFGMGKDADDLKAAMNHAAEAAVADAKPVFKQALQHMSVADAKAILTGGEDAGTQYFRKATNTSLTARFKPIVAQETAKFKRRALWAICRQSCGPASHQRRGRQSERLRHRQGP